MTDRWALERRGRRERSKNKIAVTRSELQRDFIPRSPVAALQPDTAESNTAHFPA